MPKPKTIAACLVGLAMGLPLGHMLPRETEPAGSSTEIGGEVGHRPPRAAGDRMLPGSSRWSDSIPQRVSASDPHPSEGPGVRHLRDGFLEVPASLIKSLSQSTGIRSTSQSLFDPRDRLEEILEITDREKADLQTAWREADSEVRRLEAGCSVAEELGDGSVRIDIPPDASGLKKGVGEEFQAKVAGVLGAQRGQVFITAKGADEAFASVEGGRSIMISTESTGNGRWRFKMTSSDEEGQRVWVSETIPNEIRHLTDASGIIPTLKAFNEPEDPEASE